MVVLRCFIEVDSELDAAGDEDRILRGEDGPEQPGKQEKGIGMATAVPEMRSEDLRE